MHSHRSHQSQFSTSEHDYLHLRVHFVVEAAFADIVIKLIVRYLVALLVPSVIGQVLLNCVVGQVHAASSLLERVLARSGAHVTLLEEVALDEPIGAVDHDVVAQVEFSTSVQQRLLNVFLHDVGLVAAIVVFIFAL